MLLDRIKERAKKYDMSLQDVASKTGISPNTIYSWRKKTPRVDKLQQVADLLHTTTDYLSGLTDNPNPSISNEVTDADLDRALDNAHSFDGKPMDEHDRQIIKGLLKGYFENKN